MSIVSSKPAKGKPRDNSSSQPKAASEGHPSSPTVSGVSPASDNHSRLAALTNAQWWEIEREVARVVEWSTPEMSRREIMARQPFIGSLEEGMREAILCGIRDTFVSRHVIAARLGLKGYEIRSEAMRDPRVPCFAQVHKVVTCEGRTLTKWACLAVALHLDDLAKLQDLWATLAWLKESDHGNSLWHLGWWIGANDFRVERTGHQAPDRIGRSLFGMEMGDLIDREAKASEDCAESYDRNRMRSLAGDREASVDNARQKERLDNARRIQCFGRAASILADAYFSIAFAMVDTWDANECARVEESVAGGMDAGTGGTLKLTRALKIKTWADLHIWIQYQEKELVFGRQGGKREYLTEDATGITPSMKKLLMELAHEGGRVGGYARKMSDTDRRNKSDLNTWLKRLFPGVPGDPIPTRKREPSFKVNFRDDSDSRERDSLIRDQINEARFERKSGGMIRPDARQARIVGKAQAQARKRENVSECE